MTDLALAVMRFTFNENLPDERRDGVDGSRNGEKPHRRQTGIRQPRMNALADGPDFLFAGQSIERLGDKIRQHIIELADKSLIRAEDDGAHRLRSRACAARLARRRPPRFLKQTARPSSTVRS